MKRKKRSSQAPIYEPTPEQIAASCAEIQKEWREQNAEEECKRVRSWGEYRMVPVKSHWPESKLRERF